MEVPLREEAVPVSGITIRFNSNVPSSCRFEPTGVELPIRKGLVKLPPLEVHGMLVADDIR